MTERPAGSGPADAIDDRSRRRPRAYGVTMNAIDQTLYDAFGQRQIATVFGPLTQYHVVLEVDPALRNDPDILGKILRHRRGVAGQQHRSAEQRHRQRASRRPPRRCRCRPSRGSSGAWRRW